ncbi:MAG: hypothetical protein RXO24_09405 [Acidilobus sp.]
MKGGGVLSQHENYSKRISGVQKALARHKQRKSRRLRLPSGADMTVRHEAEK